jgi:pimeloyl-ACP methyl ester carboxylesterase
VTTPTTHEPAQVLQVPGAQLYYEISGTGPVLLMIPGGAADAGDFVRIVPCLEDRYTVVRFDPRGVSRSPRDNPAENVSLDVLADDAQRLLTEIGADSAFVFGSSGGGVIGLALAARHPERVRTMVAHEPPVVSLLPAGDPRRHGAQHVYDTYLASGAGPALQEFIAYTGMGSPEPRAEATADMQAAMQQRFGRMQQNVDFVFAHYIRPITAYVPDVGRLQDGPSRVVVGVGETSAGQLAHDSAVALADQLGTTPVTFPGGHSGYFTRPEAFAARLIEVLSIP